jgi:hypothetical protein
MTLLSRPNEIVSKGDLIASGHAVPMPISGAAVGQAFEERDIEDLQGVRRGMPAATINAGLLAFIRSGLADWIDHHGP